MKIIDTHCHLDFEVFKKDFHLVFQRAQAAGVAVMQTICTKVSQFDTIKTIAEKYDNIYCSVGIHPNEVTSTEFASASELISYSDYHKVIGLGETGLDYFYKKSDRELQKKSFKEHINASRVTGLPVIVHTRSADEDTIQIISEEMNKGKFSGLIHCFTASKDLAQSVLELGFYISISGIVTFNNAKALQDVIKSLPIDRILVETDAPYLAPMPQRGQRNEPAFIKFTVEFLAGLFGKTPEYIAQATTENFYNLFTRARIER